MYQFHSLYLFKKQIFIPDVITNILSTLKVDFQKDEEFEYMSLNIEETPMKVIKQEQTAATPKVTLDKKSGLMEIMGASIPEDADALYVPIVDWLEEYAENPNEKTIFNFGLKYFNTSSSKLLLDILLLLQKLYSDGNDVLIRWHTEDHDEDMKETGNDYEEITQVPFEYITIVDDSI